MSYEYGISDVAPLPVPFASDEELRIYLGLPDTAEGRTILAKVTPEERQQAVQLRALEHQLKAGRVPRGAIACSRSKRWRR